MAMQRPNGSLPDKITPPSSFISTPLTPPPTDSKPTKLVLKILDVLRQCMDGRQIPKSQWHTYSIQREEYEHLIDLVKKEGPLWTFVETKLRYDYDPSTQALILRMPSHLHEVFLARVVEEIQGRLRVFADAEGPSKAFAENVKHNGSGRLDLQSENSDDQAIIRRQPDAMFKHCDAHWPGVIIEVSYSQKTKAVSRLADDYILETNGSVRVVVGLDIDYKTKKGTISMWRPGYVKDEQGQRRNSYSNSELFVLKSSSGCSEPSTNGSNVSPIGRRLSLYPETATKHTSLQTELYAYAVTS